MEHMVVEPVEVATQQRKALGGGVPMTVSQTVDILLVDDQPANLLALEIVLTDLGQNLIKVSSGGVTTTRTYLHALAISYQQVGEIMTLANRALIADSGDDRFITLLMASVQPETRSLVYCNAGHQPGYVLSSAGDVKAVLESTATPLGIMEGLFPAAPEIELVEGDLVFLFTDGLVDAWGPSGSQFGCQRALDVVREHRHEPAADIVARL